MQDNALFCPFCSPAFRWVFEVRADVIACFFVEEEKGSEFLRHSLKAGCIPLNMTTPGQVSLQLHDLRRRLTKQIGIKRGGEKGRLIQKYYIYTEIYREAYKLRYTEKERKKETKREREIKWQKEGDAQTETVIDTLMD